MKKYAVLLTVLFCLGLMGACRAEADKESKKATKSVAAKIDTKQIEKDTTIAEKPAAEKKEADFEFVEITDVDNVIGVALKRGGNTVAVYGCSLDGKSCGLTLKRVTDTEMYIKVKKGKVSEVLVRPDECVEWKEECEYQAMLLADYVNYTSCECGNKYLCTNSIYTEEADKKLCTISEKMLILWRDDIIHWNERAPRMLKNLKKDKS